LTEKSITLLTATSAFIINEFGDGCIDLIFSKDISRGEFVQLLLGIGDGTCLDLPFVEYIKVKAFRLEPEQEQIKQAKIALDGERTDRWKPIYVESHAAMINVFCCPDNFETDTENTNA